MEVYIIIISSTTTITSSSNSHKAVSPFRPHPPPRPHPLRLSSRHTSPLTTWEVEGGREEEGPMCI